MCNTIQFQEGPLQYRFYGCITFSKLIVTWKQIDTWEVLVGKLHFSAAGLNDQNRLGRLINSNCNYSLNYHLMDA